jgi:hypothetical protein
MRREYCINLLAGVPVREMSHHVICSKWPFHLKTSHPAYIYLYHSKRKDFDLTSLKASLYFRRAEKLSWAPSFISLYSIKYQIELHFHCKNHHFFFFKLNLIYSVNLILRSQPVSYVSKENPKLLIIIIEASPNCPGFHVQGEAINH